MNSIARLAIICLSMTIILPAAASDSDPDEPVVVLRHIPSCKSCPDWQLSIFNDGATQFIGRDSVRLLGQNGTLYSPSYRKYIDERNRKRKPEEIYYEHVPEYLSKAKKELSQIREDVQYLLGKSDDAVTAPITSTAMEDEEYEIQIRLDMNRIYRKKFKYTRERTEPFQAITERIKALYYSPADWAPAASFLGDDQAIFRSSQAWLNGINPSCESFPEDYVLVAYRDGRVKLQGRRYADGDRRTPNIDIELRIDPSRMRALYQSIQMDIEQLNAMGKSFLESISKPSPLAPYGPGMHKFKHFRDLMKVPALNDAQEFTGAASELSTRHLPIPSSLEAFNQLRQEILIRLGPLPADLKAYCQKQPTKI